MTQHNQSHEVPRIKVRKAMDDKNVIHVAIDNKDDPLSKEGAPQAALLETIPHYVRDVIKGEEELWRKAEEFQACLATAVKAITQAGPTIQSDLKNLNEDLRNVRISIGSEIKQIMQALSDVRNFFLDKNYAAQIETLEKFIDLCERMQALQRSGVLDAMADITLRLGTGDPGRTSR